MRFAPVIMFFMFSSIYSPAMANHFNCDLKLELIEDADSSELKQLIFDSELKQDLKSITTGTLITNSCFGTNTDAFTSTNAKFRKITLGDLTRGTFKDANLTIGIYHYNLNLKFAQLTKSPDDAKSIDFIASGKILPLDNDSFIHQNIKGECHLTKEQHFSMNF